VLRHSSSHRHRRLVDSVDSVEVLAGIRMEATETPSLVLEYYDKLLRTDSTNAVGLAYSWFDDKKFTIHS
jgi:hypothetical protein